MVIHYDLVLGRLFVGENKFSKRNVRYYRVTNVLGREDRLIFRKNDSQERHVARNLVAMVSKIVYVSLSSVFIHEITYIYHNCNLLLKIYQHENLILPKIYSFSNIANFCWWKKRFRIKVVPLPRSVGQPEDPSLEPNQCLLEPYKLRPKFDRNLKLVLSRELGGPN